MPKFAPIALACAASFALAIAPTLSASATTGEVVQLQNDRYAKCLDAANDGGSDVRRPGILWDCHGGDNQKWVLTDDGMILSVSQPHTCLDVPGESNGENGTQVILYPCHGGANQQWMQVGDGQFASVKFPTKCLDASADQQGANGSPIIVWDCHGRGNQRWIKNPA